MKKICLFWILTIMLVVNAVSQERLIIVGGGDRTPDVLKKIAEFSGGEAGKLLVVTWASGVPQESFDAFREDIEKVSKITLVKSPFRPLDEAGRALFLQQLNSANGVFFTGGDQNRVMDVLKDKELLDAIHTKYKSGALFAGTSAGTAIMSKIMITGEGDFTMIDGSKVQTREGIGLIPDVIVDQHFIKRSRQNRLIGLVLQYPTQLGIGIDEDTALFVRDNRIGEVLGDSKIMVFDARNPKQPMRVHFLVRGDRFDLKERKKLNGK